MSDTYELLRPAIAKKLADAMIATRVGATMDSPRRLAMVAVSKAEAVGLADVATSVLADVGLSMDLPGDEDEAGDA